MDINYKTQSFIDLKQKKTHYDNQHIDLILISDIVCVKIVYIRQIRTTNHFIMGSKDRGFFFIIVSLWQNKRFINGQYVLYYRCHSLVKDYDFYSIHQ